MYLEAAQKQALVEIAQNIKQSWRAIAVDAQYSCQHLHKLVLELRENE